MRIINSGIQENLKEIVLFSFDNIMIPLQHGLISPASSFIIEIASRFNRNSPPAQSIIVGIKSINRTNSCDILNLINSVVIIIILIMILVYFSKIKPM